MASPAPPSTAADRPPIWTGWSVPLALLLYFALTVSATLDKSNTYDELPHLTAGYSYWRTGSCRLHPENGNLPQRWAALPLLMSNPAFPSLDQPAWAESNAWILGKQFFFTLGNRAENLLLQGRCMTALTGVALALLVFCWSCKLFGWKGGMLSLILCVFCPTLLAHGGQITSDVAAAFFFLASLRTLWWTFHEVSPRSLLLSSLALAGLFLSKFSAAVILPIALVLLIIRLADGRPLMVRLRSATEVRRRLPIAKVLLGVLLIQAVMVWALIWTCYGFRQSPFDDSEPGQEQYWRGWNAVLDGMGFSPDATDAIQWARESRLLPDAYLFGFVFTLRYSQARSAFFNGELGTEGWRTFFPYAFLVKTPLPVFVVLGLALLAVGVPRNVTQWRSVSHGLYETVPLWIFLLVYWTIAIHSRLNIGHRHILPTYPAMYILAGSAAHWWQRRASRPRWIACMILNLSLLCLAAESVKAWPNYLAYFNQKIGGPANGYKHFVDSSLDWGQDLPGLKRWLDEHQELQQQVPVYLSYFGTADPAYYNIQARALPVRYTSLPEPPERIYQPGVYCISATHLQGVYLRAPQPGATATSLEKLNYYYARSFKELTAFLRERPPDAQVGYSILIYVVTEHDLERALGAARFPG